MNTPSVKRQGPIGMHCDVTVQKKEYYLALFCHCRVDLVEIVVILLVIRIQHLVLPSHTFIYSKYDVIRKEGFHIHISLCTLNNSLYNTITSPKTGNNVNEFNHSNWITLSYSSKS